MEAIDVLNPDLYEGGDPAENGLPPSAGSVGSYWRTVVPRTDVNVSVSRTTRTASS